MTGVTGITGATGATAFTPALLSVWENEEQNIDDTNLSLFFSLEHFPSFGISSVIIQLNANDIIQLQVNSISDSQVFQVGNRTLSISKLSD